MVKAANDRNNPPDYLVAEISFKKISCVGFANDQIISHKLWTSSTVADLHIRAHESGLSLV